MPWSPARNLKRPTKIIAVVDVVESVRLMEQDEQAFIRRWQAFVAYVVQRLPLDTGRMHKSLGDGLMLEFADPDGCLRAACAMQAWFSQGNANRAPADHMHLRIGAHLADYVADAYDIYGTDVNLATRIASLAGPGEIIISASLRQRLGEDDNALQLEDLGSCHLKHVREPVHAFRVGAAGSAPVLPAASRRAEALRATLAVLPFAIHDAAASGTSGEALADDLISALAASDQVQLVSRLATDHLRPGASDKHGTGQQAAPQYLLGGRARRQGSQLGLSVELVDAATGHVAWARSFKGRSDALGAPDARLLQELVPALHAAIMARETERARGHALPTLGGPTLLLSSIALMHRLCPADTERARARLEHLAERWPRHPAPHAWLAHLHTLQWQVLAGDAAGQTTQRRLALDQAATAVRCDAGSVLALAMEGHARVHAARDLRGAGERYDQALAGHPEDALTLLFQAEWLALQGRAAAARDAAQRALRACLPLPLHYLCDSVAAMAALIAGDVGDGLKLARRSVRRNPHHLAGRELLVAALALSGQMAEARDGVPALAQLSPGYSVSSLLARTPAVAPVTRMLADALLCAGVPPQTGKDDATSGPAASS